MKHFKRFCAAILLVVCTVLSVPSVDTANILTTANAASKIALNKSSVSLEVGETVSLKLKNTSAKPKWKTSNKKVATVTSKGKVTAKAAGTATVTATLSGKSYKCKVTVTEPESSQNDEITIMVWLSATGDCYHSIDHCGRMNPAKARQVSLSDAISRGYKQCSKCWK